MLLPNANDIVQKAYGRLGDLALQRGRNYNNGFGKSKAQQESYLRSRVIQLNLRVLLDHLSVDNNGNILNTVRIDDDVANRFISTLQQVAETDAYATPPLLFFKIKPWIINQGKDAPLAQFQWSPDGTTWHSTYLAGDFYFRVSVDGGTNWGPATPFLNQGSVILVGDYDISNNLFPTSGTGVSGMVMKGNEWNITNPSTTLLGPDGDVIPAGVTIRAKVNSPGQTLSNWRIYY